MTSATGLRVEAPTSDLDPFCDEFLTDPYPGHAALREAGPVVYLSRYRVWALARHADIDAVLKDPEAFCSSAGVGLTDFRKETPWRPPSLLLEADPPDHTRARSVVSRVLTPPAVRRLRDEFARRADELVASLVARGEFDAVGELAEVFPVAVFPDAVGLAVDGREHLMAYAAMVFNGFGPRNAHFERSLRNAEQVQAWIAANCEPDAVSPDGLGAKLHAAAREEGYSPAEAARLLRSFLSAGVDTTVYALGNAVACLAEHPDQYAALRADPSRARAAFEEVLRFRSPVQTFFRTTTRPVEVGAPDDAVTIPAGEKVLLFLGAANRDPRRWADPDQFDIGRRAVGHLGLGAGPHACVGQMMARLEGEVILTALAGRAAELHLAGPVRPRLNNTLHGLDSLPVRVVA
ncbi:cytochrome P450 [Pseudonocardia acaciae]|uniref:cytochrome P450 n=1 Tax=Pseudonocardia acaciae TaxID=551276 RepID=UPI0005608A26|nr:cytochrome P450 [Pseudonocardia acaciae]